MTTLTGNQIIVASWMGLRASICLHMKIPSFNRTRILAACRNRGFSGRTLAQARVWVDDKCDALGLERAAGIPASATRVKTVADNIVKE